MITARNAKEGLAIATESCPDIIISDVIIPGMNGFDLLSELRKQACTRFTPFLFLSELDDHDHIRKGMCMGAADYLTKPVPLPDLIQTIYAHLNKQKAFRENAEWTLKQLRTNVITSLPHELRTPLFGILGFGEIIATQADKMTALEMADIGRDIVTCGKRLHRIIENYLCYIQLEASQPHTPAHITPMQVTELIHCKCATIAAAYDRKEDLSVEVEPAALLISADFLRKILDELIDNAFRFSGRMDKVSVKGRVSGRHYLLSVEDDGIGMDPDDIARVGAFMQFKREQNEQQGLGLGMAIAKRMTELSGGRFTLNSKAGIGTTVTCRFLTADKEIY